MGCYSRTIDRGSCGAEAGRAVSRASRLSDLCCVSALRMHCDPYPVCSAHPRGTSHICLGSGKVCFDRFSRICLVEADDVFSEADGGVCSFYRPCGSDVAPSCLLALSYEVLDDTRCGVRYSFRMLRWCDAG